MGSLRIVPMTEQHYIEASAYAPAWVNVRSAARAHMRGDAFSGFIDDELAAVAGVMKYWDNSMPNQVGEAWAMWTKVGRAHPMMIHRAVVHGLRAILHERRYQRVQALIYKDFHAGRIWASRLGLTKESTLPRYSPDGQDMVMYRWLS